ncbi:MAG: hypothetical protein ABH845_05885 [Candidatus Omnitrophota bacterium]
MMNYPASLSNLGKPYFLCDVPLHAPWWTLTDIWPKRHVYFVRHLRLCDLAKKTLIRKRLLRIGRYFVQKAWVEYHRPMQWHEALNIRISLSGLFKNGRIPALTYAIYSASRNVLLAEAHLLYFPILSRQLRSEGLFFEERLKEEILASVKD